LIQNQKSLDGVNCEEKGNNMTVKLTLEVDNEIELYEVLKAIQPSIPTYNPEEKNVLVDSATVEATISPVVACKHEPLRLADTDDRMLALSFLHVDVMQRNIYKDCDDSRHVSVFVYICKKCMQLYAVVEEKENTDG
jgi:hypothetical protein